MKRALITAFLCSMLATACGSEESSDTPATNTEPSTADEAPAAESPAPAAEQPAAGGGGGGSVCSRARDCCNAYVDAMGGAAIAGSACTGIDAAEQAGGPAADTSCNQMISSWRQSLTAMNRAVPAACQ